ncbi:MAG TPA: DUF3800 domain-containing protein [Candidatus Dormibacteraeota bacterium]|nr:DUF3800 domain-containing protein [Candidatus Dormibacteraeota bacterium]
MPAEFVAYIDEAGDDGFSFQRGSSEWLVLAAVIVAKGQDLQTVKLLDGVRGRLGLPASKVLHFRNLKHEQRLPYVAAIAGAPLCVATVLVHKPSLTRRTAFASSHRLYFYATRYLLERVSWYGRDHRDGGPRHGDGHVEIVFSNRSGMSYEALRDYLRHLCSPHEPNHAVAIDPSVVKPDEVSTYTPSKRMGLQVADAVAGSFFYAVEATMYGYTEPRYASMLKSVVYARQGNYTSYGLKFLPGIPPGHAATDALIRIYETRESADAGSQEPTGTIGTRLPSTRTT